MNNIHDNGGNDKTLNDDLEKLGRAYEHLPNDEPPQLLDQAILNSAHRAVEKKPHWMKFGWLHGLTTAAVVVLALSIIINQRGQVPDFEDAIKINEPAGLVREKAGKKQTADTQHKDLRMEMKEEKVSRKDVPASKPVSAARENEELGIANGDQTLEPESRARRSMYAQDSLKTKPDVVDSDSAMGELRLEEVLVDEADVAADAPELEVMANQSEPATVATMSAQEAEALPETDSDIEKLLSSIIKKRQSGDESWIAELNKFKQNYPGYPLPEELSN